MNKFELFSMIYYALNHYWKENKSEELTSFLSDKCGEKSWFNTYVDVCSFRHILTSNYCIANVKQMFCDCLYLSFWRNAHIILHVKHI